MNTKTIWLILVTFMTTLILVLLVGAAIYLKLLQDQAKSAPLDDDQSTGFDTIELQYNQPDLEEFNSLDFPDYEYSEEYRPPAPLPIQVSEGDESLEEFLNATVAFEDQILKVIPLAMLAVQRETAAGNFMQMFRNIETAIEENERGKIVSSNLKEAQQELRNDIMTTQTTNVQVRTSLINTLNTIDPVTAAADELIVLLERTLTGSIPSQALLNDINTTQEELGVAWLNFIDSLKISMESLKQAQALNQNQ